jgi:membrane protein YqaA with SNARE-associated domain
MLERLIQAFLSIPAPLAIGAVFLLAAAETALFIGFLLPAELTVFLGGVLASRSEVPLAGVLAAGVAGAIVGDTAGYFVGRKYGDNVSRKRLKKRWTKAQGWVKKKGAPAVFFGRFVAFARSFIPAAAGVSRMPYRKFLPWSVAAGRSGSRHGDPVTSPARTSKVVKWMGRRPHPLRGRSRGPLPSFLPRRKRKRKRATRTAFCHPEECKRPSGFSIELRYPFSDRVMGREGQALPTTQAQVTSLFIRSIFPLVFVRERRHLPSPIFSVIPSSVKVPVLVMGSSLRTFPNEVRAVTV